MITNKYGLPDTFVRAVEKSEHVGAFVSASQMNSSPRIFWLKKRHENEVTEDVSNRIWALLGTSVHYILEKAEGKNNLTEEYLETEIKGVNLSGTSDLYSDNTVYDYKVTSVWSIIYKDKDGMEDWINQLNTYAYLYRISGFPVEKLKVVAILRDWQVSKSKIDPSYPRSQVVVVDVPIWTLEQQKSFIEKKIESFLAVKDLPDNLLPPCSDKDRWYTGDKWAVKKKGLKRAMNGGVQSSQEAAQAFADKQTIPTEIEHRPGESKRCGEYCDVREFCSQYKEMNK